MKFPGKKKVGGQKKVDYDEVEKMLDDNDGDVGKVAKACDISKSAVNFIKQLAEKNENSGEDFQKGIGHLAHRVAALAFLTLKDRLESRRGKFSNTELSILAGVASQRGMEMLSKPSIAKEPNWANLNFNVVAPKEEKIVTPALPNSEVLPKRIQRSPSNDRRGSKPSTPKRNGSRKPRS